MKIEVDWTGSYPTLCYGRWKIIIDGIDYSTLIPDSLVKSPMNTYGRYKRWRFNNWEVEWEYYYDGMKFDEWIMENLYWLENITKDMGMHEEIYNAISDCDWRHGCCGGCI